jgi:hypothetical protein
MRVVDWLRRVARALNSFGDSVQVASQVRYDNEASIGIEPAVQVGQLEQLRREHEAEFGTDD